MSRGTIGLYKLYQRSLLPMIQHSAAGRWKVAERSGSKLVVPDFNQASVGLKIFSDTILFYAKDDSLGSFISIVNASFMLLQFGFTGTKCPVRGAIGHGDFMLDETAIILGGALDEAYEAEQSQVWAGCMLTTNCSAFAEQRGYFRDFRIAHEEMASTIQDDAQTTNILGNSRRLVRYSIPLQSTVKPGPTTYLEKDGFVLDWTIRMYEGAARKSFNDSSSDHARRIAANTVAFEEWARKSNR